MNPGFGLSAALAFFCLLLISAAPAWSALETQIPAGLEGELKYLLGFVGTQRAAPSGFTTDRIKGLVGFLEQPKDGKRLFHAYNPKGLASAYYETDIARGLEHLLRLTYSPDVPEVFTAPSTLRRADWTRVDAAGRRLPRLWEMGRQSGGPVYFTGVEHLVNTPDQTTGAYYDYNLSRTVFLVQVDGRRLLLSLSKQNGTSGVGKKGLIVGPDARWDYLYTGETGLNRFGIGWAKTYMYDSYSVALYLESPDPKRQVRFGVFKWLGAGWNGINMVKAQHIRAGLERYATAFKQIVEHPRLSDLPALEKDLAAIQALPETRLRQIAGSYLTGLGQQARRLGLLSDGEARDWLGHGADLNGFERGDLESILIVEYLKKLLGKPHRVDLAQALAND